MRSHGHVCTVFATGRARRKSWPAGWRTRAGDNTLEIEVYLAEGDAWDQVMVYESVYEPDIWCTCDVITEVELGQQVQQGTGVSSRWANPHVPGGGGNPI